MGEGLTPRVSIPCCRPPQSVQRRPFCQRRVRKCNRSRGGILETAVAPHRRDAISCWRCQPTRQACGGSQLCGGYGAGLSGVSGRGLDRNRPRQFIWASSCGTAAIGQCLHTAAESPPLGAGLSALSLQLISLIPPNFPVESGCRQTTKHHKFNNVNILEIL